MAEAYFLFPVMLLVLSFVSLLARRSALRREKAEAILSQGETSDFKLFSRLIEKMRGGGPGPPSRRTLTIFYLAIGLAAYILTHNLVIAILPYPMTSLARRIHQAYKRRKSLSRKEERVLELIDSLIQSLRSGLSLQQSLEVGLEDTGEDISDDILEVLKDMRLESGLEEALAKAASSSPIPSLRLTYSVLGLLHGRGGDLPRILEHLRKRVAEGLEIRREARVLTSQSRASGYLVSSLPVVFLGLQAILNPRSLRPLLSTPMGNLIIAAALGLNLAAFFLIRKIVNPEI